MGDFDPKHILEKYQSGTANDLEKRWVESWWFAYKSGEVLPTSAEESVRIGDEMFAAVLKSTHKEIKRKRLFRHVAVAASFLMLTSLFVYLFDFNGFFQKVFGLEQEMVIAPGGNRAMLILGDGSTISLDENQSSLIVGDRITYGDGSELVGFESLSKKKSDAKAESEVQQITIAIPRGGQYNVTLPDGSNVWLNSSTTLTYPTRFVGGKRVVQLEGEAYFQVARRESEPFVVFSDNQAVEVLGTEFNLAAYAGDAHRKTTLVSGSVRVYVGDKNQAGSPLEGKSQELKPGEQSLVNESSISVSRVNLDQVIGWKNGYMTFENETLPVILEKAKRWYANLEVNFVGQIPNRRFNGGIPRDAPFEDFLKVLELNGIKFRKQGFTLYILN